MTLDKNPVEFLRALKKQKCDEERKRVFDEDLKLQEERNILVEQHYQQILNKCVESVTHDSLTEILYSFKDSMLIVELLMNKLIMNDFTTYIQSRGAVNDYFNIVLFISW